MGKPAVILICADKGGVGKTTITRTLLDYFSVQKVGAARAFDTEFPKGNLKRFHPDLTEVVDFTSVDTQITIFDPLEAPVVPLTVIDVRAGLMSDMLRTLHDIGFIGAVKRNEVALVLFHVITPTIVSLAETVDRPSLPDAKHFMVKNLITDSAFVESRASKYHWFKDAVEITVPKLDDMAMEQVEVAAIPFVNFVGHKAGGPASYSWVLRKYVYNWLVKVWAEYDRVGLTHCIMDLQDGSDQTDKSVVTGRFPMTRQVPTDALR